VVGYIVENFALRGIGAHFINPRRLDFELPDQPRPGSGFDRR
jgi:hypothetical protein